MASEKQDQTIVAEQVFEVRYLPTASFVDVRGNIADSVSSAIGLPHWQVDENTINFRDKPEKAEKLGAFISFRNAGFFAYDLPTRNFFEDKAESFWKAFVGYKKFQIPTVTRLGVRTKAFLKLDMPFDVIHQRLREKLLSTSIVAVTGGKLVDSTVVIDLEDAEHKLRMQMGPIQKNEMGKYMKFPSPHFAATGLFVDCDVYSEAKTDPASIVKAIRVASKLSWAKVDNYFDQIGL